MVDARDQLGREDLRRGRILGRCAQCRQHRVARGLHRRGRAGVDLEVAELALDDQDPRLHLGRLERDVGQRLDVEPRRHLDDRRRHPAAREPAAHPGAEVAHGLRLELIDEDR